MDGSSHRITFFLACYNLIIFTMSSSVAASGTHGKYGLCLSSLCEQSIFKKSATIFRKSAIDGGLSQHFS